MGTVQGFPTQVQPFVGPNGVINRVWFLFLQSLWNRSGGAQGGVQTFTSGDIKASGSANTQGGWLACNGSAVSRATYSALFGAIGTTWGIGDGATTFNLPDLRGKALIGVSGSHALGATGGSETTTLSTTNLPSHNHGVTDPGHTHTFTGTAHNHAITDGGHTHTLPWHTNSSLGAGAGAVATPTGAGADLTGSATTGITVNNATAGGSNASNTTGVTTNNTGSGTPATTMSPFAAVTYLVKT